MEKSRRKKISYYLKRKWPQVIRRGRQREKNEEKEERKVRNDSLLEKDRKKERKTE